MSKYLKSILQGYNEATKRPALDNRSPADFKKAVQKEIAAGIISINHYLAPEHQLSFDSESLVIVHKYARREDRYTLHIEGFEGNQLALCRVLNNTTLDDLAVSPKIAAVLKALAKECGARGWLADGFKPAPAQRVA